MIVYRELDSLVQDLGFSSRALYSVSNNTLKHYHEVALPKRGGGIRRLHVPDPFLMAIQRSILRTLLPLEDISPCATAYRPGSCALRNALPHTGKPVVLKLDVRDFFDHLIFPLVREKAFPAFRYSEANRTLLSILCVYEDSLPQGAPTSPAISNIIMKDFDNTVGAWAAVRGIAYTRYCDDMTFSGDFDPGEVIPFVSTELRRMGLFLNRRKTVIARQGQRQVITGVVVNEQAHVPADYKRHLRQEMHHCMTKGLAAHVRAIGTEKTPLEYRRVLLGRVNHVLSIEPENQRMQAYRTWLCDQAVQRSTDQ